MKERYEAGSEAIVIMCVESHKSLLAACVFGGGWVSIKKSPLLFYGS